MNSYGLMGGSGQQPQDLMGAVGHGAWWSRKQRAPDVDIPTLHYDIQSDYRGDPSANINALMERWRQSMPEATSNPDAGRVPQFAAPSALAPSTDRQSTNMLVPSMMDFTLEALKRPIASRVDTFTKYLPHLARSYFGPTVTMDDISGLLPKQDVPFMGPPR